MDHSLTHSVRYVGKELLWQLKMESNDFPWVWSTTPIYVTQRIQGLKSISTLSWHFQSILSNFVGGATQAESGCKLGDYQPLRRHLRPHKLGRAMQVSRKLKEIHPHFGPKLFLSDVFQTYITIGTEEDIGGGSLILYQEEERTILFVIRWRASLMLIWSWCWLIAMLEIMMIGTMMRRACACGH